MCGDGTGNGKAAGVLLADAARLRAGRSNRRKVVADTLPEIAYKQPVSAVRFPETADPQKVIAVRFPERADR